MGQQSSKSHAPLTFGYINQNPQGGGGGGDAEENDTTLFERYLNNNQAGRDRNGTPDFVLDNPHLYKLEFACQHCSKKNSNSIVVAEKQVDTPCKHCRQNKRLSLVRRDLASDLNYIDETYYPNIVHYEEEDGGGGEELSSESDNMESMSSHSDDDTSTLPDEEGWSKLTIGEITPSIPKRLVSSQQLSIDLSGKSLIKLSSSIGYLDNLTKLDLSDNQMISLPKAIGQLKNLRIFNASRNQLESIPDTITSLKKLKAVNFSQNKLTSLPKGIGSLPCLIILILNQNSLTQLPRELAILNDLITLNVSNNPLKSIPAEIATLKTLRKLIAEECPFETEFVYTLKNDPPSLFELCARQMVSQAIPLPASLQHHHIAEYFKKEQTCSFCYGPFFDSFVTRGKFIERTGRQIIALDYKLCCAHWSDEEDRSLAMFSTPYYRQQYYPTENEIVVDGLSTPYSPALVEDSQQDYFSTFRSTTSSALSGRQSVPIPGNHRSMLSSPSYSSYSSEDTLLSSLVSTPDSIADYLPPPPRLNIPPQRPSLASTSSLSSHLRPRSSSTSSSSLLRIQAMHQNLSSALRQQQQQQQDNISHNSTLLPFAALNGRQSEEANRILSPTPSELTTEEEQGSVEAINTDSRSRRNKKPNSRVIREGFASLGAKLGRRGRDRSDTL